MNGSPDLSHFRNYKMSKYQKSKSLKSEFGATSLRQGGCQGDLLLLCIFCCFSIQVIDTWHIKKFFLFSSIPVSFVKCSSKLHQSQTLNLVFLSEKRHLYSYLRKLMISFHAGKRRFHQIASQDTSPTHSGLEFCRRA